MSALVTPFVNFRMLSIISTTLLYRLICLSILSIYAVYVASYLLAVREIEQYTCMEWYLPYHD